MTIVKQTSQKIDTNVTIRPPDIEIYFTPDYESWIVKMTDTKTRNRSFLKKGGRLMRFKTATEAFQYCIELDLVVTKAYTEMQKKVKKLTKDQKSDK